MDINACFPSKFVAADDLRGQDVELTIERVAIEQVDSDGEQRPVVYFTGMQKGLVLNRTNANSIAQLYGPETELWTGQQITLFPTETDFRGKTVACIRVRTRKPQPVGSTDGPPKF